MKRLLTLALTCALAAPCFAEMGRRQRVALFVGIDVSGSFISTGHQPDSLEFLAHYIYAHLNGSGGLEPVKSLFVGSIGGNSSEETKSFRPIEDFQGKSIARIHTDLKAWFPKSDANTDFNVFFRGVSQIAQKRNLSLTPIEIVLVTDGIPDSPGEKETRISQVDVAPLEFLSRRVTLRLLYPEPTLCSHWETLVPRKRMRMWTVDNEVMAGWKRQYKPGAAPSEQGDLWKWMANNVDYRVSPAKFKVASKNK